MDKITQQTAASAEESASASEVMNAQAEQMKALVNEMISIVGGSNARHGAISSAATQRAETLEGFSGTQKIAPPANLIVTKSQEMKPDQIIPLDDYEDF